LCLYNLNCLTVELIFVEKITQKKNNFVESMAQNRCWSLHEGTSINNRAALIVLFRLQPIKIHGLFIKLERESKKRYMSSCSMYAY
jgi:hypothetical protein